MLKHIIDRGVVSANWHALLLGLLVFGSYLLTLAPGLQYTDSGELAAACVTYGVAHPTGYPLFTLLGHVWTLLPWTSAIVGLNVLAALWTSIAVGFVYLSTRIVIERAGGSPCAILASAVSALIFGWSGATWAVATSIEVYSLHAALVAITLYCVLRSTDSNDSDLRWSVISGVLAGLLLANHLSSAFLLPGFFVLWLAVPAAKERLRQWYVVVLPALLGVALYATLPIRSAAEPPINWGMVHRGWDAFLYHVRGTQFSVWMFSDKKAAGENFRVFREIITSMTLWVGVIPAILAPFLMGKASRRVLLGGVVLFSGNLFITLGYSIPDIEPYFIPSIMIVAIAAGTGLALLARKRMGNVWWLSLALPITLVITQFPKQDKSTHTAVDDYTDWVFNNAEPNAIILSRQWDFFCSAAWYRQVVLGQRLDISLVEKELIRRTWYVPYLAQRYPTMMRGAMDAANDFMPYLQRFEEDASAFNNSRENVVGIQTRFVGFLNAILDSNTDKPLYITPELLNDEPGFAVGYTRIPAGPLVRLVPAGASATQRESAAGLQNLVSSLSGRTDRLDEALRQTVVSDVATMAMFMLDGKSDTAGFRRYREFARALDARSIATTQLNRVLP